MRGITCSGVLHDHSAEASLQSGPINCQTSRPPMFNWIPHLLKGNHCLLLQPVRHSLCLGRERFLVFQECALLFSSERLVKQRVSTGRFPEIGLCRSVVDGAHIYMPRRLFFYGLVPRKQRGSVNLASSNTL